MTRHGCRFRRVLAAAVAALTLTVATAGPLAGGAAAGTSGQDPYEAHLARVIAGDHNAARAAAGLPPLAVLPAMAPTAEGHNDWMVATGTFQHSNLGSVLQAVPGSTWAGENLYKASYDFGAGEATTAWMNSSGHRANILNSRATHMYVAVNCDAAGNLWSTVQFVAAPSSVPRTDVPVQQSQTERDLDCRNRDRVPWAPFASPEAFVTQQYRDFLFREPDAKGLAYWVDDLRRGRITGAWMIANFLNSPEFDARIRTLPQFSQQTSTDVRVLMAYQGLLGRPAEPAGAAYWTDQVRRGLSLHALIYGFLYSPEYANRVAG